MLLNIPCLHIAGSISPTCLHTAFKSADPKNAEKSNALTVFFPLLRSGRVKTLHKMLVKSTPGWEFTKLLMQILNIFVTLGLQILRLQ